MARVTNPASISAEAHGIDNGVHGAVRHVKLPPARTAVDCENAAVALLSDAAGSGWAGKYETWSDFLPGGAQDIFPGDALNVNIPSRAAAFQAIVHEVDITCKDLSGEHSVYQINFSDDAAKNPAFEFDATKTVAALNVIPITNAQVGTTTLPDLTAAMITQVTSTTASIDAGIALPIGGGIEVRWSDAGWSPFNDQNLAGRFTTQNIHPAAAGQSAGLLFAPVRRICAAQVLQIFGRAPHRLPLMTNRTDDSRDSTKYPLVMRVTDNDFQCEVLEKLARLEARMEMLFGSGQRGRMSVAEDRIEKLERNDVRRGVYDRLVNAVLTTAISVLIALHDRWWK
jgi:hypothetical protein